MAGPSAAQLQAAFNVTLWDGVTPYFSTGEVVYQKGQYVAGQTTIKQQPYRVLGIEEVTAANGDLLDGNGDVADGSVAADYSITGTGNQSNIKWPVFYRIQNWYKATEILIVHEATLKNLAGLKVLVDLVDNPWVDPS